MFKKESPFSFMPNINNNNLLFHNTSSNHSYEQDFFSIENHCISRTKGRPTFYNNGSSGQMKKCFDYFLNQNANFNIICITRKDFPLNFNNNENKSEKKSKNSILNTSSNHYLNNDENKNNIKNKGTEFNENDIDNSCAPPPSKASVNSCFSKSTFNSSTNSNYNNNWNGSNVELEVDLLSEDIKKCELEERKNIDIKGSHLNMDYEIKSCKKNNNKEEKRNAYSNYNMSERVLKLFRP